MTLHGWMLSTERSVAWAMLGLIALLGSASASTGGNAQAWTDAITRVEGFLGKHLAATNPR